MAGYEDVAPALASSCGECPLQSVPRPAWRAAAELIDSLNLMQAGILPVAGGMSEQAQTFVTATRIVARVKAEVDERGRSE